MSEQIKEFIEMPKQFMKEGTQFINRCTKPDRKGIYLVYFSLVQNLMYLKLLILFYRVH
jgi:hypothetical protein